jgi:hypothetical protein
MLADIQAEIRTQNVPSGSQRGYSYINLIGNSFWHDWNLNAGNISYHSVKNLTSSHRTCKEVKIKIHALFSVSTERDISRNKGRTD